MYLKRIFFLIIVVGLILMGFFSFYVFQVMFSSNTNFSENYKYIYIKTGSNYVDLIEQIKPDLINIDHFDVLAKRKMFKPKPGKYIIKKEMSNNEIINSLRSRNLTVDVVFNNIKNMNELAGVIGKQIELDSVSFLDFKKDTFFENKGFDKYNKLSMYIPNSYNFYWNTNIREFNNRMFKEYTKFWELNNRKIKAKEIGMSQKEIMILASIVYEESNANIDLPRIAGVYINRLKNNWKLQADPTIKYAAYQTEKYSGVIIKRVLNKHLKINSPYNTYKFYGLPPGLISMPSIQAIDAVLNFEEHNYFFFVADPENPGKHTFTKTLSEHKRNARKLHRYLNKKGIKR